MVHKLCGARAEAERSWSRQLSSDPERDDSSLGQGGGSGGTEKELDSDSSPKAKPTEFLDGMDVWCKTGKSRMTLKFSASKT